MILVTAFDLNKQDLVSISIASANDAAGMALDMAQTYVKAAFVRITTEGWTMAFPVSAAPSKARLAHIIEHRAPVEFA